MPLMPENVNAWLVGGNATNLAPLAVGDQRVEFHEDVAETTSFLARFGQSLMPISSGGGTRLKVLEAMAAGVAIVGTRKAVEGIDIVPGEHFVHAESAQEFVDAFHENRKNPEKTAEIAETARSYVRQHFSNDVYEKDLETFIEMILKKNLSYKNRKQNSKVILRKELKVLFDNISSNSINNEDYYNIDEGNFSPGNMSKKSFLNDKTLRERDILPFVHLSNSDDVILDIGAHLGYTAASIRNLPVSNYIHSIEPMKVFNPSLENLSSIDPKYSFSNIACSDSEGVVKALSIVIDGVLKGGLTSIDGKHFKEEIVDYLVSRVGKARLPVRDAYDIRVFEVEFETKPLDMIVESDTWVYKGRKISGLKIDVEGHEHHVIEGAKRTLEKHKPLIMLEVSDINKMNAVMRELSYLPFERKGNRFVNFSKGHYNMYYCHEDNISYYQKIEMI